MAEIGGHGSRSGLDSPRTPQAESETRGGDGVGVAPATITHGAHGAGEAVASAQSLRRVRSRAHHQCGHATRVRSRRSCGSALRGSPHVPRPPSADGSTFVHASSHRHRGHAAHPGLQMIRSRSRRLPTDPEGRAVRFLRRPHRVSRSHRTPPLAPPTQQPPAERWGSLRDATGRRGLPSHGSEGEDRSQRRPSGSADETRWC